MANLEVSINGTIDKHAPIRIKRVGKKNSLWVTDELRRLLFERDSLKKRAAKSGGASLWHQYKQFRNRANNEMKRAKRLYFTNNVELHKHDMKKTWKLINDLTSRHCRTSSYIKEVKIDDQIVKVFMQRNFTPTLYGLGVKIT